MAIKGNKLISEKAADTIRMYLQYHEFDEKLRAFNFILEKDYNYCMGSNLRGHSDILSPSESFKDDMLYYLNMTNFMFVNEKEELINY